MRAANLELLESRRLFSGQPFLSIGDAHVYEGNSGATTADLVVTLSNARPNQSVTVNYSTQNGTAVAGADYSARSGKLTFAKGETSKTISVPVIGDRLVEPHEYFFVNLKGAKNAKIADGQGIVEIIDDEPRISIYEGSALEGNSGATSMDVSVSLFFAYDVPVTVQYATANNGSAVAGTDYTAAAGTVTFAPGETTKTIPISIHGDREHEPNETFVVNLSNPSSNAEIVKQSAVCTILNDEPQITIDDAWYNSYYDGTAFTFTVSLSAAADEVVTVNYATADGTAIAGVDYAATSGTLTFAAGTTTQTITVDVIDTSESEKYFVVNLSGASANAPILDGEASGSWYYDYGWGGGYDGGWYDYYGYYWW